MHATRHAGSSCINPENGFHFSRSVFTSSLVAEYGLGFLKDEDSRVITLKGQQYVPGDRNKVLLPLVSVVTVDIPIIAWIVPRRPRWTGGSS